VIPHRRLPDAALIANERHYADIAYPPALSGSLSYRYMLTDDYYAGLLPQPMRGREFYLPQLAVGRLVETPTEMLGMVDSFLADSVIEPGDALITGYDFLIDQANAITASLQSQGIPLLNQTHLIDNSWTAVDFANTLFSQPVAPGLISLNSHFEHYRFFPNDPQDVYATQIVAATDYNGALIFSVGCHSGLNVTDALAGLPGDEPRDWPQAFNAQNATFFGNTGFGYGDSDLVAYSELLMLNFVEALGDWSQGPQTVGQAMMMAKHHYFNSMAAGSFSNYDEKVIGIMTLYGLPMLRINMPITSSIPIGGYSVVAAPDGAPERAPASPDAVLGTPLNLTFDYERHDVAGRGSYFTVAGQVETYVAGGRPILPLASVNIDMPGYLARGVLWTGGSFVDVPDFDPIVSRVITDERYLDAEPGYGLDYWFPVGVGSVNRFLTLDGESQQRLVLVPGQYKPDGPNQGTQRLYTSLDFEVYHAPFNSGDFVAPNIWDTQAWRDGQAVNFAATVTDEGSGVQRVVVLYRPTSGQTWHLLDLTHDPLTNLATGSATISGPFEYAVQAVDRSGNVSLALDYGGGFGGDVPAMWYLNLPIILKP
ncbi:MAG TPA: C25 family cysteine peptidase, partial [Chloroflexota bacterium]|nr:C25 family cysteine peptidase [Chloroflexota bacterium]